MTCDDFGNNKRKKFLQSTNFSMRNVQREYKAFVEDIIEILRKREGQIEDSFRQKNLQGAEQHFVKEIQHVDSVGGY